MRRTCAPSSRHVSSVVLDWPRHQEQGATVFRTSLQKKDERERVRAALLRAALRLGAVHGFASLGLREVAREAGIAPTSFYRHFADMQELGASLSGELVGAAIAEVSEVLSTNQAAWAAVLWDAMLAVSARDPELMRFFVAERVGASASLRASLQRQLASLASALATAADSGSAAADVAVLLLLDASTRALDLDEEQRAALRESCVWAIDRLLSPQESGKVRS
jgi:AcrR family transcriptional regulator